MFVTESKPNQSLKVVVFNVGQGDNILLEFPNCEFGIIDFYYDNKINPISEPPALTYLKLKKQKGENIIIKFLHLSHYHLDHFKGFLSFLSWIKNENIPLNKIYFPSFPHPSFVLKNIFQTIKDDIINNDTFISDVLSNLEDYYEYFKRFELVGDIFSILEENLKKHSKDVFRPISGPSQFYVDDEQQLSFFCVSPINTRTNDYISKSFLEIFSRFIKPKFIKNHSIDLKKITKLGKIDENELSVIFRIMLGKQSLIFMGDAIRETILESNIMCKEGHGEQFTLNSIFIKVPHHGSHHSSSEDVWECLIPVSASSHFFFSAGANKKYNHPHKKTLEHINKITTIKRTKSNIYSTNFKPLPNPQLQKKNIDWVYRKYKKRDDNLLLTKVKDKHFIGYEFIMYGLDNDAKVEVFALYPK